MQIKSRKKEFNSTRSYQLNTIKVTGNSRYIQEFKINQIKEIRQLMEIYRIILQHPKA